MTHWTEETYIDNPEVIGANLQQSTTSASNDIHNLLDLFNEHDIDPEYALDVACGIGRHAVPLAETGIGVHGVDISPDYIETAQERAIKANVTDNTTFEVRDMRNLDNISKEYDLVLNWLAFGHFDDETNEQVANGFRERVADDGALVLGVHNKESTLANFQESSAKVQNGFLKVNRSEYKPETGRSETAITMFREQEQGYDFIGEAICDMRLYTPAELRWLLNRVGFSEVHLYGSSDGGDLNRESDNLIAIAIP